MLYKVLLDLLADSNSAVMAPHIFSWGGYEVKISPVVSSAGTPPIIPIESFLSDPCTKSPIIPEASTARPGDRVVKVMTPSYNVENSSSRMATSHFWCVVLYGISSELRSRRSMASYTAFTAIFSLAILCTSPLVSSSSGFVTTNLYRSLCR